MQRVLAGLVLSCIAPLAALAQQFPPPAQFTPPPAATTDTPASAPSAAQSLARPVEDSQPAGPAVLTTRQSAFSIPFTVDPRSGATEVQLYVSRDRGNKWQLEARQRPEIGQFLFRTDQDGEFWFASHTISPQAPQAPATFAAELRVRIDTTSPKVELEARVGSSGEVIARWQASDEDLVAESVKLEYQPAGEQTWQTVVLDPEKTTRNGGQVSGEATWFVRSHQRAIALRIVARDGAGNSAIVNRGVYLPNIAQRVSPPPAQAPNTQNAPGVAAAPRTPAPLDVDPFRRDEVRVSDKPVQRWEPEKNPTSPAADLASVGTSPLPPITQLPTHESVSAPVASAVANRVGADPSEHPFQRRPLPSPETSGEFPSTVPTPSPQRDDLPPGEQPSFTSKLRFKLDYDSDDVPLDDIAAVELWGTHDGGNTWLKWGVDPDRESPFEVEVEQEGVFGYRVVVVHKNGMASHTPRAGDPADIWVGVDSTRPQVKLRSVAFGKGPQAGQLIIQWQAADEWFTPRPVTILYATQLEGPWSTVAAGLANTGEYLWRVEPSVPRRVFLKIEVRDLAGNVTEDQMVDAVELEGLVPRGRIRAVVE